MMTGSPVLLFTDLTITKPTATQNTKTMTATLKTNVEMSNTIAHGRTDITRLIIGMTGLIDRIAMKLTAAHRRRNTRLEMFSMIARTGSTGIMARIRGREGRIDRIGMRRMDGPEGGRMVSTITIVMESEYESRMLGWAYVWGMRMDAIFGEGDERWNCTILVTCKGIARVLGRYINPFSVSNTPPIHHTKYFFSFHNR